MEMIPDTSQQLWRTEFDKQYTPERIRALNKHTRELIKEYRGYGLRSSDTAEDRIYTALVKLFDGSRTWEPNNVDLHGFLIGVVASDLSAALLRHKRTPMVSFDRSHSPREDDYTGEAIDSSGGAWASMEAGWKVPIVAESMDEAWEFALAHLRVMASKKKKYADVLALLDAFEDGFLTKSAVMAHLGWTAYRYRVANERLIELANATEPDVREAIRKALAN
jgi:hypothetical protein